MPAGGAILGSLLVLRVMCVLLFTSSSMGCDGNPHIGRKEPISLAPSLIWTAARLSRA
jgi:hypothetical protein